MRTLNETIIDMTEIQQKSLLKAKEQECEI